MDPGTAIRCETSKWGDRPHWQFEGFFLGSDEHGDWIGVPQGTHHHRPGFEFHSEVDAVTLVPTDGWYAATFHRPGIWCHLYIDVVQMSDPLPAALHAAAVEAGRAAGEIFVDDEDEFAEHQVLYGYPADVVTTAQASCDALVPAVHAGLPPYDGTHQRWLAELTRLMSA